MERIRVATLQYYIRPVKTFDQFRDQVEALVETAVDYKCHLLVFPEYFTIQLLTLGERPPADPRAGPRPRRAGRPLHRADEQPGPAPPAATSSAAPSR